METLFTSLRIPMFLRPFKESASPLKASTIQNSEQPNASTLSLILAPISMLPMDNSLDPFYNSMDFILFLGMMIS